MTENFFNRIKTIRLALKYSQSEFADLLGVGLSTYRKWEQGKRAPSYYDLVNISERLYIEPGYFMGTTNKIEIDAEHLREHYIIKRKDKGK